jgi:riboflavin biosynthesis pyrimidine reductase
MSRDDVLSALSARKTGDAQRARIATMRTTFTKRTTRRRELIGNDWTRAHYDGDFDVLTSPSGRIALSLVFVQSADGNTAADDPSALGADATDKHLVYEGLSRVAADAVLAGAGTLYRDAFFSVWHPELVALRLSLDLPRHPSQIVISKNGQLDFDAVLFNAPEVDTFLISGPECLSRCKTALAARPWIRRIPLGDDLRVAFDRLRAEGIRRVSAIGGRYTATRLVDADLVQDLYLTTTSRNGGEPRTPWYDGERPPRLEPITRKEWENEGSRLVLEHVLLTAGHSS